MYGFCRTHTHNRRLTKMRVWYIPQLVEDQFSTTHWPQVLNLLVWTTIRRRKTTILHIRNRSVPNLLPYASEMTLPWQALMIIPAKTTLVMSPTCWPEIPHSYFRDGPTKDSSMFSMASAIHPWPSSSELPRERGWGFEGLQRAGDDGVSPDGRNRSVYGGQRAMALGARSARGEEALVSGAGRSAAEVNGRVERVRSNLVNTWLVD